ncbi:hypothetical protein MUP77_23450 [Candidatus Bathyarchaeota archaeon]|nr:hypothetical protein [Candidatus Bathyarchaeota archaeon]
MPTQNKKRIIAIIGVLLILISVVTFFYEGIIYPLIRTGPEYHPYRIYSFPLGVLGFIVLVLGLAKMLN